MINERPDKLAKRFAVLRHRQVGACVADNGLNFPSMTNNTGIQHQPFDIIFGHRGNGDGIEMVESMTIVFPFLQDGYPR
ncbi:hypothetical protein D3C81_1650430 [compost metagenome]